VSNTGPGFTCNASTCQCACPTEIEFEGNTLTGILDTGWTGQGHDATVVSDGKVTVAVTSCAGSSRPCGVCSVVGPIDNPAAAQYPAGPGGDINSRRCTNNTGRICTSSANCAQQCIGGTNDGAACSGASACPSGTCASAGTCEYYFGTYLPLAAGGVSTCVGNQINGTITGTANVETGAAATTATLTSRVYSGPTLGEPCPRCLGDGATNDGVRAGSCSAGDRAGLACDVNGTSPNAEWGSTSLDCPPLAGGNIANLTIDLTNTTGTKTRTLSAASPNCRAVGFTANKCQCDTCNVGGVQACASNADCPISGRCVGGTNGGKACTADSACPSGTCNGRPCTTGTDCPSGTCTSGFCSTLAGICGGSTGQRCAGGTNVGAPCNSSTQCPGSACNIPGAATAPNQCDLGSGDCSNPTPGDNSPPTSPTDFICMSGPFEQFCGPTETFRGCGSDTDCQFPGDTCSVGRFRECFDNGLIGDTVTARGVQSTPVNDASTPTLAALFCVGPTTASAVNTAAGLPGLGKLELPGDASGLP
jgi:hypothetical protein